MKRAIITVKGKVQKVRYRSKVKEIADELGVVGEVENLADGPVRISAEAEEGTLNEFITKIKITNYLIDVRDVSVSFEAATGEFNVFKKIITGTMYEVVEWLDEAAGLLERLIGAVIHGHEKIVGTIEQGNEKIIGTIDRGNAMLAEKIDAGRGENREGFAMLAEKIDAGRGENREGFAMVGEKVDGIKEDTSAIRDSSSVLADIHRETLDLQEKYEQLSMDVEMIKQKIK